MALPTDLATGDLINETWVDAVTTGLTPTAWTAVTFANSWVNFGSTYQVAQYRKVGDLVQIRGQVKSGTIGLSVFTLPTGFRPPADMWLPTASNGVLGTTIIQVSGAVTAQSGSNTWFTLDCSFSVTA